VVRWQTLPAWIWRSTSVALAPLARFGAVPDRLPRQIGDLAGADDTAVMQSLFCHVREQEHRRLCLDRDLLPVRRLFEPFWEHHLPRGASRLECLSARISEINIRLKLPNDYLFKVDMASMRESLEVRVPMLDEDLFAFGLSLPHRLKVNGRICKRVLRGVADLRLPTHVAAKPKWGFEIPVDTWVDSNFKSQTRQTLLSFSSSLPDFFQPDVYRPVIEAFYTGRPCPAISRLGVYRRVIMLLSVHLALNRSRYDALTAEAPK
jgi:asparagine synthase (glutamine-hydrolysing)